MKSHVFDKMCFGIQFCFPPEQKKLSCLCINNFLLSIFVMSHFLVIIFIENVFLSAFLFHCNTVKITTCTRNVVKD